ncbi:MAG TPA: aminoglycoside adenylyltransferase domain-containing protein, partial [Nitrospira sp.]|nr:aminoglycoside adenylyltransferase domain-containing protein [Nitrospira sp.]
VNYTWTMQITPDHEIRALIGRLTDEIRRSLNGSLVGLYVYGSLVTGDFEEESSDIDLLAVVSSDVEGETFERLDRMHARFVEDHPAWEDRIEVAYLSAASLWKFKTETNNIAVVSPGEPFHLKAAGRDWLMNWHTVREMGVTLYGPPPQTLIPEISRAEFVESAREHARSWEEWVHKMRTPGSQAYAVLTMCRELYTRTHGEQVSKKKAALWAKSQLPQWAPLIERSWSQRSDVRDEETDEEEFYETVCFVQDVAGRVSGETR